MQQTLFSWKVTTLGPFYSLVIPASGVVLLLLALFVVARDRRPGVIAACLALSPIPLMIGLSAALEHEIATLAVVSVTGTVPTPAQIVTGVVTFVVPIEAGLLAMWPAFLVLSVGLVIHTWRRCPQPPRLPS